MNYTPKVPKIIPFYAEWMNAPTLEMLMGNVPRCISPEKFVDEKVGMFYDLFFGSVNTYKKESEEYIYNANIQLRRGYELWCAFIGTPKENFEIWKTKSGKLWCYSFINNKIQIGYDANSVPIYRELDRDDVELIEDILANSDKIDSYILKLVIKQCTELYYKKKEGKI